MHLTISSLCSVQLISQYLQLRKEEDGADPWLGNIDNWIFEFKHKIYNCFSEVERESALYGSRRNQSGKSIESSGSRFLFLFLLFLDYFKEYQSQLDGRLY